MDHVVLAASRHRTSRPILGRANVAASKKRHRRACTCAQCGEETPFLDYGYQLPDCVWSQPENARSLNNTKDFAELGSRRFIRGLLPVRLEDGEEFRYGVWLEVDEGSYKHAKQVWNDDARYLDLRFKARVANAAPPWGDKLLGVEVEVAPRETTGRPFVTSTSTRWLQDVLREGWTEDEYTDLARKLGYT